MQSSFCICIYIRDAGYLGILIAASELTHLSAKKPLITEPTPVPTKKRLLTRGCSSPLSHTRSNWKYTELEYHGTRFLRSGSLLIVMLNALEKVFIDLHLYLCWLLANSFPQAVPNAHLFLRVRIGAVIPCSASRYCVRSPTHSLSFSSVTVS